MIVETLQELLKSIGWLDIVNAIGFIVFFFGLRPYAKEQLLYITSDVGDGERGFVYLMYVIFAVFLVLLSTVWPVLLVFAVTIKIATLIFGEPIFQKEPPDEYE